MQGSIIIAGTQSGVGKTTISIGIMAALRARGLTVQPFKVGPDFIDPAYHRFVTGAASRNLDGWMMGHNAVREVYANAAARADVCVIEGVMGLFDGIGRGGLQGSTAEAAKITGAPVVLVVDARSMAGSAAAVVKGFETLDPAVNVAGVILNRVGSKRHEELLRHAIAMRCRAKVIGVMPRDEALDIPSRHLGLTTDVAGILSPRFIKTLTALIEKNIDLNALLRIAGKAGKVQSTERRTPSPNKQTARLAVAMDEAFCFYYPENLEILEARGIEVVPFSPLKDGGLPEGVSGIYLGGGYPEMYARGLACNDFVKGAVMAAARAGMPIYAECGGFMYLTEGITDHEGVFHPMVGLYPARARMLDKRKALGYREITVDKEGTIFPVGKKARGHEFHYSEIGSMKRGIKTAYKVEKGGNNGVAVREGFMTRNVLAGYVHLHFMSNRSFARSFADCIIKHNTVG